MVKEIFVNFDTIFWTSINKKKAYLYVTKLKSRIYKATQQKKYQDKKLLQNKLICSSAAKYYILCELIRDNEFDQSHISQLIYQIYLWDKICLVHDSQLYYIIEYNSEINFNLVESILCQMNDKLLVLALDPEIQSIKDKSNGFFSVTSLDELNAILEINFLNHSIEKYYFQCIDLTNYFKVLYPEYIFSRLHISKLLQVYLKKSFKSNKWLTYIYLINKNIFDLKYKFSKFILQHTILTFMAYLICLELRYVSRSSMHSNNNLLLSSPSYFIVGMGLELLLVGSVEDAVYSWHQSLNSLLNYSRTKEINLSSNLPFNICKGINFAAYFLYYKKNVKILISPSLNAQMILIEQVDKIFYRSKGQSVEILISALNKILLQWGNYFVATNAYKIFTFIDYCIYLKLRSWIFRQHTNWGRKKIINKYFFSLDNIANNHLTFHSKWIFHTYIDNQLIILLKLRYFKSMIREVI